MRVGNVEVEAKGSEVIVRVHGCTGNFYLTFTQEASCPYDAVLRSHDIYRALRQGRIELQREVIDNLACRELPGVKRGKLARALDMVRGAYEL